MKKSPIAKTLLVSSFLSCLAPALSPPLLASELDDSQEPVCTPSRTPQEWWDYIKDAKDDVPPLDFLRAIQAFDKHEDFVSAKGYAFHKLLTLAPVDFETLKGDKDAISWVRHACYAFHDLSIDEKFAYKDLYLKIMLWFLEQDQELSWDNCLYIMDSLVSFELRELAIKAAQKYAAHKDVASSYKMASIRAATAYCLLGDLERSSTLLKLSFALHPDGFTKSSLCDAACVFHVLKNYEMMEKSLRMLLEKKDGVYKFDNLTQQDFLQCAHFFATTRSYDDVHKALDEYFMRETQTPDAYAYTLMADCYNNARNAERACEYWDLAIQGGADLLLIDCINAANSFSNIKNYHRARTLVNRAMAFPEAAEDFTALTQASNLYYFCGDFLEAEKTIEQALTLRNKAPNHDTLTFALLDAATICARTSHRERAEEILKEILNDKRTSKAHLLPAGLISYNNQYTSLASDFFAKIIGGKGGLTGKDKAQLPRMLLCHLDAKREDRARELWRMHGDTLSTLLSFQTAKPSNTANGKHQKAPANSRTQKGRSALPMRVAATLRAHIINETIDEIRTATQCVADSPWPQLQGAKEEILSLLEKAEILYAQSQEASSPPTSRAPSSPPQKGSSEKRKESAKQGGPGNFLPALQNIKEHIEALKKSFDRQKHALKQEDDKARKRTWMRDTLSEESFIYDTPMEDEPRAEKEKTTKERKPKARSPSKGSPPRTPRAQSVSSAPAPAQALVTWRITPTAMKHMEALQSVPGFQTKFREFRHEIDMEPWGRRGHTANHASGRAKLLKGHDNVFSRRFARGERFFYRVERQDDGRVIVTILGLMKHDL
ncbi:MAG: tetratricopeptide repeat protein [Proteobacteria bacterium]|nr:tetratricopeptide repeat protein [Pseudomonadota bacterium]